MSPLWSQITGVGDWTPGISEPRSEPPSGVFPLTWNLTTTQVIGRLAPRAYQVEEVVCLVCVEYFEIRGVALLGVMKVAQIHSYKLKSASTSFWTDPTHIP